MKARSRGILCLIWLVTVVTGGFFLSNFENLPGRAGQTPLQWPEEAALVRDPARPTLLLFAHPHCPCTHASIGELNRLMARCRGKAAVNVLFFKPAALPDDWARTSSWSEAAAIPGVSVRIDPDGAMARRFGAETSGYVLLFDANGQLLFNGGITAGRGHFGDNAGENVIVSLIEGKTPELRQTPVYGCSLTEVCEPTNRVAKAWK